MKSEKREATGWWMWAIAMVVIAMIVFGILNALGFVGYTMLERKVFEESYQKQASDDKACSTYNAQQSMFEHGTPEYKQIEILKSSKNCS